MSELVVVWVVTDCICFGKLVPNLKFMTSLLSLVFEPPDSLSLNTLTFELHQLQQMDTQISSLEGP